MAIIIPSFSSKGSAIRTNSVVEERARLIMALKAPVKMACLENSSDRT